MNTAQRRTEILKLLQQEEKPVAARAMASQFGVSRQVIVQDMAVIRASTPGILSTTRGYVLQQDKDIACTREFKVRHGQEQAAEELNLIVDCGGRVKNISISHRVYGRVTAEMDIRCTIENGELKIGANGKRWLEILGCGMVHPNVLKSVGVNPDEYQGFAFGMGIERLTMLKYGISDMRKCFEADTRWLSHYGFEADDTPNIITGLSSK